MEITVRTDEKDWGFVEKYRKYDYSVEGYVYALCSITLEGGFSPIYVFKERKFIPFKDIDKTVGGNRYLRAKKPLYSKIGEGFIVELKAGVNFETGEYLPDKSNFVFYTMREEDVFSIESVKLRQVLDVSDQVKAAVEKHLQLLAASKGDRLEFLKLRGELCA